MRCPFCHNESIVNKTENTYETEDVLNEIKKRTSFISAVVVTGGEPTIYKDQLIDLLEKIKALHLKIKLDTNGTNPTLLKKIIDKNLIDYVAMDIKNTWTKYETTAGAKVNLDKIKESIELIENSNLNYEFRMTINKTMHQKEDILEVLTYVKQKDRFFLQPYKKQESQIINENFGEFSEEEIRELQESFLVKN